MIIIQENNFYNFNNIKPSSDHNKSPDIVVYPSIINSNIINSIFFNFPSEPLEYVNHPLYLQLLTTYSDSFINKKYNKCMVNSINKWCDGMLVILKKSKLKFINKITKNTLSCQAESGCVVIFQEQFNNFWEYIGPLKNIIYFYNTIDRSTLFLTISNRIEINNNLSKQLKKYHTSKTNTIMNEIIIQGDILGKGDYGYVVSGKKNEYVFAVKYAKIENNGLKKPFDINNSAWREWHILNNIIKPIILNRICPNLPLLYDTFVCTKNKLHLRKKIENKPANILIMELADGNMKDFFNSNPVEKHLYSALFQLAAGLHAIQYHGQLMNYDVKVNNILYYNVNPGGYWHYIIHNNNYYIPNLGKLFILSDFGISRSFSPKFCHFRNKDDKTFRLGKRFAIIKNNNFLPIETDRQVNQNGKNIEPEVVFWKDSVTGGSDFRMNKKGNIYKLGTTLTKEQIQYLQENNITTKPTKTDFFEHSEIIPPFEFYNDLQDLIRCFVGGKRTTQKGCHKTNILKNTNLYKNLIQYVGKSESANDNDFNCETSQVLAGYFISSFFNKKYKKKPKTIIETYCIS